MVRPVLEGNLQSWVRLKRLSQIGGSADLLYQPCFLATYCMLIISMGMVITGKICDTLRFEILGSLGL